MKNLGRSIVGVVDFATLAFGFVFEGQLMGFSHTPAFIRISAVGLAAMLVTGFYFLYWGHRYYPSYIDGVSNVWNWIWNIPLAGLGRAFVALVGGLLPFYGQAPLVLVPLILYFALVFDVWLLKKVFNRAINIAKVRTLPNPPSFGLIKRFKAVKSSKGFIDALSILAIATTVFGLQFIYHYFDMVVSARYASYTDWLEWVLIAVGFGALMLGPLVQVFPWKVLKKSSLGRRAKLILGF